MSIFYEIEFAKYILPYPMTEKRITARMHACISILRKRNIGRLLIVMMHIGRNGSNLMREMIIAWG